MKTIKRLFVSLTLVVCILGSSFAQINKSDLKILYVGVNPDKEMTEKEKQRVANPERMAALIKTRTSDYEAFLKQYFNSVDVVYSEDYKEGQSANYDVTIIDDYLPSISGGWIEDPETGERTYEMPRYLTEDFNHATLMIGEPSAYIGQGRQLKIDHLCLCLDAHAHGMKLEHPIFHKPYQVSVSYEDIKTPGNYKVRYGGRDLGDTMPMWRIQTEGYEDGKGFPVGLVSTGYGFDNGIDAEQISNGKCAKGVEATAIGRHANFFHWGFAAAPEYMTESAKLTLINSIHYIAQFKGAKQVTKKIKGTNLRLYMREQQWTLSDEGWARWEHYLNKGIPKAKERKKEIQAKKDAGEALDEMEKMILQMPIKKETREWTIRREPEELKKKFGEDWAAYENYYKENMDYFYALEGEWYKSAVDEDAKALGIANSDIKLLETALKMLKDDEQAAIAQGILTRYTTESFETAGEWKKWYKQNRKNLYFSEGDCFKWIVLPKGN